MERAIERVEIPIQNAVSAAEHRHQVEITWDASIDFLPDPTVPDDQQASRLIPAIGIYLEIAGPRADQVTTSSFYYAPYLIDADELTSTIDKAVENIIATRTAEGDAAVAALKPGTPAKTESRRKR